MLIAERRLSYFLCFAGLVLPLFVAAQGHERGERGERRGQPEHGERWQGDIRRFHEHDIDRWRGGHWFHGLHEGRNGWWWVVGATWYFYPAAVYPYPDPYEPPPAAAIAPPGALVTPQYWYRCANPSGYYPYVPQCNGNWERIPAR